MKPGIYDNIGNEDYHALIKKNVISKTGLDKIRKSPAHFKEWTKNPPEPTPAMVIGQRCHTAILESHDFLRNLVLQPEINKRTKAGKEEWEAFQKANEGKIIVKKDEFDQIQGIVNAVYSHPIASEILRDGKAEQSIIWEDEETGIACRCRPDYLRNDDVFVDVKTTVDASFREFQRSVAKFRYHVQSAFYMDGINQHRDVKNFILIAVEKTPPFGIGIYHLDLGTVEEGRKQYREDLTTYAECLKTNKWPGYAAEIQTMGLPAWAYMD